MLSLSAALLCLLLANLAPASAGDVYIIRHGEKTSVVGCLNTQGEERAAGIVHVFNGTMFPEPKSIFACCESGWGTRC
jgi:hypothetical protein